ncbi:hypothetical protein BS17DRAFT_783140 [Gyrodon lividus]|nr:hypothetical protein BS17DRAFT_783140 [Gyrodon lividus]
MQWVKNAADFRGCLEYVKPSVPRCHGARLCEGGVRRARRVRALVLASLVVIMLLLRSQHIASH